MAKKLKSNDSGWWLTSNQADGQGINVQAAVHMAAVADGVRTVIEYLTVDYDAPKWRKWEIRMVDQKTGAEVTLHGPEGSYTENHAKCLAQLGMTWTTN